MRPCGVAPQTRPRQNAPWRFWRCLAILLPGFAIWFGYGLVTSGIPLVVPNAVAFCVAAAAIAIAAALRIRGGRVVTVDGWHE